MANKRKSLAQELADLFNPAPSKDYDPDALDLGDGAKLASDDEYGEAQAAPSKRAPEKAMPLRGDIVLEDAAYRGRKTSRAAIFGEDAESEGADDDKDVDFDVGEDEEVDLLSDGEEDVIDGVANDNEEGDDGGERRAAAGRAGPSGRGGTAVKAIAAAAKSTAAKRMTGLANGAVQSFEGEDEDEEEEGEEEDDDDDEEEEALEDEDEDRQVRNRAGAVERKDEREEQLGRVSGKGSRGGHGNELEALEAEYEALQEEDEKQLEALRQKGERDRVKGAAVRNQQVLYERALEQRILLQKCLQASNGLPRPETYATLVAATPEVRDGYSQLAAAARNTLDQLLELQHTLMARNPAITVPPSAGAEAATASGRASKRRRPDTDGATDDADDNDLDDGNLEPLWQRISARHEALAPFRDTSLDSWHRRTVLSSGSGALRNSGLRALNQSISSQVQALMRDPAKFIKRTRLALSACPRVLCEPPRASAAAGLDPLGSDANGVGVGDRNGTAGPANAVGPTSSVAVDLTEEERDPETYDDSEFYQQLLKEFLDKGLAEGVAAAPKAAKKRKLVDRRASKGRKLRYHVQEKLVAFMAPVDFTPPPFAVNLFSNLFGHAGK